MQKIDYYFDFLSPFSYFSWINSKDLRQNKQFSFALKPVVMGTIFNHWAIKGPGEVLAKRHYMLKQCFLYAAKHTIPFTPPKMHPFNPLYALRLATVSCAQEEQEKIIDLLWRAAWGEGLNIGEPEVIEEFLQKNEFNGKLLIEKSFERDVKNELKKNTQEAISKNVFGVPTFVVENEIFWGNDQLENLKTYLENGKFHSWNEALFIDRIK